MQEFEAKISELLPWYLNEMRGIADGSKIPFQYVKLTF